MRYTASDGTAARDGECDDRDQINVVILYDRANAGERAMNKARRIADDLADDIELHFQMWRLEVLLDSRAASTAATDLATADLLLLALEDARSLHSKGRRQLLEALHQLRGLDAAVAILTHDDSDQAPSRFDFLRNAAENAGVRFLFPPARRAPALTDPAFYRHPRTRHCNDAPTRRDFERHRLPSTSTRSRVI